jgi:hypothetical protein
MGYQIVLKINDVIKAAHAALYCQINFYTEARVKPRDPQKILEGWMAQQAVGHHHYGDPTYDVMDWIHTGCGDTPDGYEIRSNSKKTLWIGAKDRDDQEYWMVMPIEGHRFWLLGSLQRKDIKHLEQPSEYRPGNSSVLYADYLPHLQEVYEPMHHGRVLA